MDSAQYFPQLYAENFNNWKFRVKCLLTERQRDDMLCVEIPSFARDKYRRSFILKDAKAKSIVVQCIMGKHLYLVKDAFTAKEKILQNMFERKSTFSKLHLRRKLFSLKYGQNEKFFLKILHHHKGDGKWGIQNR